MKPSRHRKGVASETKEAVEIDEIEQFAFRMRKHILGMALKAGAGSSHLGGGLSMVDITATLFGGVMNYDPKTPLWPDRDRFILSKGHGVLGYYSALCEAGYLTEDDLMTFEQPGSNLLGHPVMNRTKGIDFSTGSLGMGLSLGIGVALSAKRKEQKIRVFVLMGDGETNEGSVWEGAMAASHYQLDNLVAIIDKNGYQQTGANSDIMCVGNIVSKLYGFGWEVKEVDGHNVRELYSVLGSENNSNKPLAIIANTVKGKGVSFAEHNNAWHHGVLTKANYEQAMDELLKSREKS
jgi:transketolase